ncbi:MAG: glycoside hydrolase family 127 protein [Planctomycetales bacterium]|nr:glycoside hydrolase family 127 protein [Planctomycetales bacterium]
MFHRSCTSARLPWVAALLAARSGILILTLSMNLCLLFPLSAAEPPAPVFNRQPLATKPYTELPLGAVQPDGWLRDELRRMADGMTGHLDEWYPEVCGPRNAWLGGDGDTWERGPYWIDGLYPLAKILNDQRLEAKAMRWIEWTLANQRPTGQIGPRELEPNERTRPAPQGAQIHKPDDWWPRMVMLKILQQHYQATGDPRVTECLTRYFRYQLAELPQRPLHDPNNPRSGSWWAAQRGGDNLMVVLWLYNVTGEPFLLDLANLIHEQTVPVTTWFQPGPDNMIIHRVDQGDGLHCVNLAQMMKTPIIRWQQDQSAEHLVAVERAFQDIRAFHGQPHGLYGGDEGMHGDTPDRGSELCSAVEMMFSLEKMFEITGDSNMADRLERVAFNALPTQCADDHRSRQYFQQTNQVQIRFGDYDFFNDDGDRLVYGLLQGYPCCTCNLHQGWPKFAQHIWMASRDGGLATVSYVPSRVTARVGDKQQQVTLRTDTNYPFQGDVAISVIADQPATFPLHVRIPGWANGAKVDVNNEPVEQVVPGTMVIIKRAWNDGDCVHIHLPMSLRVSTWYAQTKAVERGPLVYALDIEPKWHHVDRPRPADVPESGPDRGWHEVLPGASWNYALPETVVNHPENHIEVVERDSAAQNPWTRETAPVELRTRGVQLSYWTLNRHAAAIPPLSPAPKPDEAIVNTIRLIPYGATTLRIAAFPWVRQVDLGVSALYTAEELRFARVTASHTFAGDTVEALRLPHTPQSSHDTSIPRWTSWPQVGQTQWVEMQLKQSTRIESISVFWYDDDQGIALPGEWHLETKRDGRWHRLATVEPHLPAVRDTMNTAALADPTTADIIRIVMTPAIPQKGVGILAVSVN